MKYFSAYLCSYILKYHYTDCTQKRQGFLLAEFAIALSVLFLISWIGLSYLSTLYTTFQRAHEYQVAYEQGRSALDRAVARLRSGSRQRTAESVGLYTLTTAAEADVSLPGYYSIQTRVAWRNDVLNLSTGYYHAS